MDEGQPARVLDATEVRFRVRMIQAGVWATYATCGALALWLALTWDRPYRGLILALIAIGAVGAAVVSVLPAERIVRSTYREAFFLTWSSLDIALIVAVIAADGGVESPAVAGLFLPLVFAAVSYPLPIVIMVSVLDLVGLVSIGLTVGAPGAGYVFLLAACLALTAVMCMWEARINKAQRNELTRISRTDPLTACLNRRGFEERLDAELDHAARGARPLALLLIDLDRFKEVNDTRGHAAGDELLCWTVDTLRTVLRPMDAVARLGGDEFALLLPSAGEAQGMEVADRVNEVLAERVEATSGLACFPADGSTREELHHRADLELYAAKNAHGDLLPGPRELSWAAALAKATDARAGRGEKQAPLVAEFAAAVAARLGWSVDALRRLRIAGLLHDIGKVSVSDRVLRKPGPLTPQEFEEIKLHPVRGAEIVGRVEGLTSIVPWIRHSHEHFDGSGYPDGLAGKAIPEGARVLLVADAFHSMTSDRPYRAAMSTEAALEELECCAGRQFDPTCVEALKEYVAAQGEANQRPLVSGPGEARPMLRPANG